MKIGLLTDSLDASRTGIGVVGYNLIRHLGMLNESNEYYLIHNVPSKLDVYRINHEMLIPRLKPFGNFVWRNVVLPSKLRRSDMDVVHDISGVGPLMFRMPFKKVITIHDLSAVYRREAFKPWSAYLHHHILYPLAIHGSDKVVTISNYAYLELVNKYNIPREKIIVIYNGVDERYRPVPEKEITGIKKKYGLDFPFFLYVGIISNKKNIPNLVRAFHMAKKDLGERKLVLSGGKSRTWEESYAEVERLGLEKDVIFTGYVPDEDLVALYNAAETFAFPSLYEGFGIPPLEAMACGTPVFVSNTTSLPEVVGDAGLFVDPHDVEGMAGAMIRISKDNELREELRRKGFDRARQFSWEKAAAETLQLYQGLHYGD